MLAILLNDLFRQRWIWAGTVLSLILLTLVFPADASLILVVSLYPVLLLVSTILMVITTEGGEEKNHGYLFLNSLPVTRMGIVTAKYVSLLLFCGVMGALTRLLTMVRYAGEPFMEIMPVVAALSMAGALVVGAFCYTGAYVLGLARFTRTALVVMMLAQVVILWIGMRRFTGWESDHPLDAVVSQILALNPWWYIGAAVAIWLVLLGVTACFRKRI